MSKSSVVLGWRNDNQIDLLPVIIYIHSLALVEQMLVIHRLVQELVCQQLCSVLTQKLGRLRLLPCGVTELLLTVAV